MNGSIHFRSCNRSVVLTYHCGEGVVGNSIMCQTWGIPMIMVFLSAPKKGSLNSTRPPGTGTGGPKHPPRFWAMHGAGESRRSHHRGECWLLPHLRSRRGRCGSQVTLRFGFGLEPLCVGGLCSSVGVKEKHIYYWK